MTPEGRVKAKVKKALAVLGPACWRFMPVQTGYGAQALDFLLAVRGRFVAIETKAPGKSLTPLQESTKADIEAAGGIVLIVWDEDSLAIAMKIVLALEFTPHAGPKHISDCIGASGQRPVTDVRIGSKEEAAWEREQHERPEQPDEAPDAAAGGHHGSPGT